MTETTSTEPAVQARASGGTVEAGFEPLAEEFRRLMARGPRGGAVVVRAGERVLADLHIGWEDRACSRPWRPETQALAFSATKGLAAMVVHRLADRGLLDYDEPVASFWPEFAAAGKSGITVRELLSHRAGLYDVQAVAHSPRDLLDHLGMEERLASAGRQGPPGRPAYHAFTFGWLAAGLARSVTGKGIRELVRTELAVPLDTNGLEIGAPGDRPPAEWSGPRFASTPPSGSPRLRCSAGFRSPGRGSAPFTPRDSSSSAGGGIRRSGGPRCPPSTAP